MRPEDKPTVRALDLFSDMSEGSFDGLFEAAFLQRFPPGVQLVREGDPADFLHIVLDGQVETFATWNGRETTLDMLRPVTTFILAAVLRDATYLMSARTAEASRILMIPAGNIRAAVRRDAAFAQAMIRELATGFRQKVMALKDQKLRSSVERLANFLLRLRAEGGGAARVELPFEKRTLASLLGMTPENLSRAFGTLKPHGVEVDGRTVTLNRPADLEALAKPHPLIDVPKN